MMTIEVLTDLATEEKSDFHDKLLHDCLANIKASRTRMSKYYLDWDKQDQIYRGEKWSDLEDRKNRQEGKPEKFIVANSHSQIQAFVSFLLGLFTQNATPFELKPTGNPEFGKLWEDCEAILERDCDKSHWNHILYQFLLDTARFGIAPLEVTWSKETVRAFVVPPPVTQEIMGIPMTSQMPGAWQEFVKFEGNRVRNISPYRFFPDMNFPISEFYRGSFCGSEEDYTMGDLRDLQSAGEVTGVEFIQQMQKNLSIFRGGESRFSFGDFPASWSNEDRLAPVVITKLRKWITPSTYKFNGKTVFATGDAEQDDKKVLYTIWYANDNRIIKAEIAKEFHQEFGYAVGQYTPDIHKNVTMGLADLIYPLQETISWFINSHIRSVTRVMQNRMVINPTLVDTKSYDGDSDILLRKGVGRMDPRMAVSQVPAQDVTAAHMGDAAALSQIMQMITGVNDNLQGQPNAGRRSAQENRVQTAGAAGRLKMHAKLLWEMGLGRIGRLMLSNTRQSLSKESFAKALGLEKDPDLETRYSSFIGTPEEIICGDDYLIFDSTLASEKGFAAQSLQELLSMLLQANPQAAVQFSQTIDISKIFEEMQWLRDGTSPERFKYSPQEMAQMQAQAQSAQQQQMIQQQQQGQLEQAQGQQQMLQSAQAHSQKLQQGQEVHQQKLALAKSAA